ncbi:MAG: hypothetical protein ABI877_23510 [Gemmatimonadaceae bacterium]
MYPIVLGLHNVVRWLVIAAGLYAAIRFWRGWLRRGTWSAGESTAARLFVSALDMQFLLGILLYVFLSPITRKAFSDMGAAMRDAPVRYFVVEHVVMMFAAIAIAHVGSERVKRATTDAAKFQTGALWFGVAIAAILGFVPWGRPLFPSF